VAKKTKEFTVSDDAQLVVEIHVPLVPAVGVQPDEYQFPWIDHVTDYLSEIQEEHEIEIYDEGEEYGDFYVFAITGASENELISVATTVAGLRTVPAGAYAMVTTDEATSHADGTRVELDG
jgi:hypothetical protein